MLDTAEDSQILLNHKYGEILKFKTKEDIMLNTNLPDKAAALVNTAYMIGSAFGPILGSTLYGWYNFTVCCLCISAFVSIFTIMYAILACCCGRAII